MKKKPKVPKAKRPATYSAAPRPEHGGQAVSSNELKKVKTPRTIIPTINFMVTMNLERRQRLEAVAVKLDVSLKSLIEEGVDLIIEKKKALAEKAFLKG